MSLLEYLVIGSYLYTTAAIATLWRFIVGNHLKALDKRITVLEDE